MEERPESDCLDYDHTDSPKQESSRAYKCMGSKSQLV